MVSILIPAYNHSAFIEECLGGVVGQTFGDWEVILLDDQSQDDTLAKADAFLTAHQARFRAERNSTNLGTYGTLQRALDLAQGEWVAVLNSDDVWEKTKLEKQLKQLGPEHSFSFTLGHQIDSDRQVIPVDQHADWPREATCDLAPRLMQENRVLASSVVFRRQGLRFHAECRYSGDWLALVEASQRGKASLIAEPLSHWRIHTSNAHFRSVKQVAEEIAVRKAILASLPGGHPHWAARSHMDLAALHVLRGEMSLARAEAQKARRLEKSPATLKRWLATCLPASLALQKLWPGENPLDPGRIPEIEPLNL